MNKSQIAKFLISLLLLAGVFSAYIAYSRMIKEITIQSPKYLKRTSKLWEKRSRIVGELKDAPLEFTIEVMSSSGSEALLTEKHNGNLSVYETGWLVPGTYTVVFSAEGYQRQPFKKIKLEPFSDCLLNVTFGKIAYKRE